MIEQGCHPEVDRISPPLKLALGVCTVVAVACSGAVGVVASLGVALFIEILRNPGGHVG